MCYNYYELLNHGHRYQHIFYLEVINKDDDDDTTQSCMEVPKNNPFAISLHAIATLCTTNTMHVIIDIHDHQLTTQMDMGSIQNFINTIITAKIGLSFVNYPSLCILISNGDKVPFSIHLTDV
jgi:hypothetical protein